MIQAFTRLKLAISASAEFKGEIRLITVAALFASGATVSMIYMATSILYGW